jgi:hypothetical protein
LYNTKISHTYTDEDIRELAKEMKEDYDMQYNH